MERQEHLIFGFQIIPNCFYWVVLAVLLLSVSGWGACRSIGNWQCDKIIQCDGYANCGNACTSYCGAPKCTNLPSKHVITGSCYYMNAGGYDVCGRYNNTTDHCPGDVGSYIRAIVCSNTLYCDTQCEADSVACVNAGNSWDSQNCQCNTCSCDDLQSSCESINGEFQGNCANADPNGGQCCVGTCYLCNTEASRKQQEIAKRVCCSIPGLVPPKLSDYCFDMPPPR